MGKRLVFGSGRFSSVVVKNRNEIQLGGFDIPTKLVKDGDVLLCLPEALDVWGMYPTHQDSWLCLSFIVACHSRHNDEAGLAVRKAAWQAIPEQQWPGLAFMASQFADEFRTRLTESGLDTRKVYKSLTRALQDCVLYLVGRETFSEDQDAFLQASSVRELIEQANRGRAGELTPEQGLDLAEKVDTLVSQFVDQFGGLDACKAALAGLQAGLAGRPGRVILLPDSISLDQAKELAEFDIIVGTPDEHDMDVVSIVGFVSQPTLFQLVDQLSGQRLDIIAVSSSLGPNDVLTGGHPSFQSVAEMLLANGSPVSAAGRQLVSRLACQVSPAKLAQKYLEVARQFVYDAGLRKSWATRRKNPSVPQVKKAIPLYRVACDLLPRAMFMLANGRHTGGLDIAELSAKAGLAAEYQAIRSFFARQDATQEELEKTAEAIIARLKEVK